MTSIRDIEAKLRELEDDEEDEVSLADAWRRAIESDPSDAEDLMETYR